MLNIHEYRVILYHISNLSVVMQRSDFFGPLLFFQKWNHLLKVFAFYEWWLSIVMDEYRIIRMIIRCFGVHDIQIVLCFCNIWICSLPRVRSRLSCIRLPREWVLLHMPNRYIICCMTCQRIWVLVCHTPSCLLYVSLQHVLSCWKIASIVHGIVSHISPYCLKFQLL